MRCLDGGHDPLLRSTAVAHARRPGRGSLEPPSPRSSKRSSWTDDAASAAVCVRLCASRMQRTSRGSRPATHTYATRKLESKRKKKTTAEKILYDAMDKIKEKSKEDPIKIFNSAISNVKPNLEVRSRRVGGATYQVPVEVKTNRGQTLALRWLMDATRKRKNKTMAEKLYSEILDASQNKGSAIKKREDTHKMAESNKAFAHFRW